jgi:hypothetical protein
MRPHYIYAVPYILCRMSVIVWPFYYQFIYIYTRRGADKYSAFAISYFPISSLTKRCFLDGLKKLEQRSHKCVELGGIWKHIFSIS